MQASLVVGIPQGSACGAAGPLKTNVKCYPVIKISDKVEAIDRQKLELFLRDTVWQSEIGEKTLNSALENSICISAFSENEQVGFARAVTDKATFCWVDDVYVDPDHRGKGIASRLIKEILNHKELCSVATWFLSSSNQSARRVFTKYGFEPLQTERSEKLMALPKVQNEAYRT